LILSCLSSPILQAQPNTDAPLGINLGGVADWEPGLLFVDVMKGSRHFISQQIGMPFGQGPALDLDSLGWVRALDSTQWIETLIFTAVTDRPSGIYNVFYEGEGTFQWAGDVISSTQVAPGHIQIDLAPGTTGITMRILDTDPNNTGNYLRNIRIIMPGYENTYQTDPFYHPYVDLWKNFKLLRFMDLLGTNNNYNQFWHHRTLPDYQTQSSEVAIEYLIQLANHLQTDAWFCIPHLADDNYIAQFATLVRDNLDPNLKVYVEYSNEVWNGIFLQSYYAETQGLAQGLSTDPWEAKTFFFAKRSVEMFQIFDSVFNDPDRVVNVLAWQSSNVFGAEQIMNYDSAYFYADAFAIAPYFGNYLGDPSIQNTVAQLSSDEILDLCLDDIATVMEAVDRQAKSVNAKGLSLIAYEAGQHLVGYLGAENNQALTNALIAANRHPRMHEVYMEYLNRWKHAGGEMMALFSSMGHPSKWGSWGIVERQNEVHVSRPKYAAIHQFMECNSPPWWEDTTAVVAPPPGNALLNYRTALLYGTVTENRTFSNITDSMGTVVSQIIPFSTDTNHHIFNTPGYPQGEFYGGIFADQNPNALNAFTYYMRSVDSTFIIQLNAQNGQRSDVRTCFLWKKHQFTNPNATATVGKFEIDIVDLTQGELRFLIRNDSTYYISDFVITSIGTFSFDQFNNSIQPGKRWRVYNPTSTEFGIPAPMADWMPMTFDNVTEIGFVAQSSRYSWGNGIGFSSFKAWERSDEDVSVWIEQGNNQSDPTVYSPIHFTATFSHPVNNFDSTDVVLMGSANATQVSVNEMAPMDGTTYDIVVSGMTQQGSVFIDIPAGVATTASGYPNYAASSIDHIVQFNIAPSPNVTLEQSASQIDPDLQGPVNFTAIFSEAVRYFDEGDVSISGTANPTTVLVAEAAPFDGTTYDITVSGMDTDGTVQASIPAGAAQSLYGADNLASTSIDNLVSFYVSNPPLVTLEQAANQSDPAFVGAVSFTAQFNQAVIGFDESDIQFGGAANPTGVTVVEIAPFDSTTYTVLISGITNDGDVTVSIPQDAAQNTIGSGNLTSSSNDNSVQYFTAFPIGGTLINYQGSGPSSAFVNRTPVLSPDSMMYVIPFSTAEGDHIFETDESQSQFYGGITYDVTPDFITSYVLQMRLNDNGFAPNRLWAEVGQPGPNDPSRLSMCFMWKKEQFLSNMATVPTGFDNDTNNSTMAVNIILGQNPRTRFIIRNCSTYYISEFVSTNTGLIELKGFGSNPNPGMGWAEFDPSFDGNGFVIMPPNIGPFQAVDFDNVTEVGFLYDSRRTAYATLVELDAFVVNGITAPTRSLPTVLSEVCADTAIGTITYANTACETRIDSMPNCTGLATLNDNPAFFLLPDMASRVSAGIDYFTLELKGLQNLDNEITGVEAAIFPLLNCGNSPSLGTPIACGNIRPDQGTLTLEVENLPAMPPTYVLVVDGMYGARTSFTIELPDVGCRRDAFEPNDISTDAAPIPITGVSRSASICPRGDVDWFEYNVRNARHLKALLSGLPDEMGIRVYDMNGTLIDSAMSNGLNNKEIILNNRTVGEVLRIEVFGLGDAWSINGYRLRVHARNTAFAQPIRTTAGNSANTSLIPPVQLYPNPTKDMLQVRWKGGSIQAIHWQITDIHGRVLAQEQMEEGNASTSIDVSAFTKGVYLFRSKVGESVQVKKWIKE